MSNARMAAHTASSWQSQPHVWKKMAPAAGSGSRITARPCRPMTRSRLTTPSSSSVARLRRRAVASANAKSAMPIPTKTSRLVIAQAGIRAVRTT